MKLQTEEQKWERSFQTGPRLTPEEAHRVVVLRQRLTDLRYLSSEYLLRRATLSPTKGGKIAWQSVWALMVFVEHQKRFPRQGELYPYLHKILDESKVLEDLDLPELDVLPNSEAQEAQKSLLEKLRGDVTVLSNRNKNLSNALSRSLSQSRSLLDFDREEVGKAGLSSESYAKQTAFWSQLEAIRKENSD